MRSDMELWKEARQQVPTDHSPSAPPAASTGSAGGPTRRSWLTRSRRVSGSTSLAPSPSWSRFSPSSTTSWRRTARRLASRGIPPSGRERKLTREFLRLQSRYLFQEHFCLFRLPNEEGHVERLIGFTRRNFLVPVSQVGSLEELYAQLRERCQADLAERVRGRPSSKQDRLSEDQSAFLPVPKQPFEARRVGERTVDYQSLVRFDDNEYSVPGRYAHRKLLVVATVQEIRLVYEDRLIAPHPRCWDRERTFFDPIHYLALLERNPGGLDYARPLEQWGLPECFSVLRRRLKAGDPSSETRSYIRCCGFWRSSH